MQIGDFMTRSLSDSDRRILRVLQSNGRLANVELAERVGMSASPCLRRLRQLEAEGVVTGYTAEIDRKAVGLDVRAFVRVNMERHADADARAFEQAIARTPEVVACYMMAGEMDFLLHVVVPDLDAFAAFTRDRLMKIPGVKDVHTSFVIEEVKRGPDVPVALL
jgi:Lrp/AsnC family leucine-responsive transcriptional regulator